MWVELYIKFQYTNPSIKKIIFDFFDIQSNKKLLNPVEPFAYSKNLNNTIILYPHNNVCHLIFPVC